MEPRAHHILIGLFTLLVISAALIFTLWLAKAGSHRDTALYDIVFTEAVTGLSKGNAVHFNGVRVGDVTELWLDKKDPGKVWARIRIDDSVPINQDTRARLTIANITGTAIIQLISGSADSPALVGKNDGIPVIPTEPSPFAQLRSNGEELLADLSQLTRNASNVLSDANTTHLSNILTNVDNATTAIAEQKETIKQTIGELSALTGETRALLNRSNQLMEKLESDYQSHGRNLFADASQAMESFQQASKRLDEVITNNQESFTQGVNGLNNLGPLLAELRSAVGQIEEISREFQENPQGYLLGGESIKEYSP